MNLWARISLFVLLSLFCVALCWADSGNTPYVMAGMSIIPIMQKGVKRRTIQTFNAGATYPRLNHRDTISRDFVITELLLRMQAQVDIAAGGGADGVLNSEQPWSLIRNLQLIASSPNRPSVAELINMDFAALRVLSQVMYGIAPPVTALAAPGIQAATQIIAACKVPFFIPRCVSPRLGALNTHECSSLDLSVDWGDGTDLITGGTRVITLSNGNLQVDVEEFVDPPSNAGKYAVTLRRFLEYANVTANSAFNIDVKRGFPIRGILLKQFTRAAGVIAHTPVATIINSIAVQVNGTTKMEWSSNGIANSGFAKLQGENLMQFGVAMSAGYAFIDFLPDGNLDRLLRGSDYTNFSLQLSTNTIADGCIRAYPLELVDQNQ